jgi:hypothetical protein
MVLKTATWQGNHASKPAVTAGTQLVSPNESIRLYKPGKALYVRIVYIIWHIYYTYTRIYVLYARPSLLIVCICLVRTSTLTLEQAQCPRRSQV